MSRRQMSQTINVTGSREVSFGNVTQSGGAEGEEPPPVARVLFLAANPEGTARLRLDREARAIDEALRASGLRDRFELEQCWAVTDAGLQDALLRHQPLVVHLSGHGQHSAPPLLERETVRRDIAGHSPGQLAASSSAGALLAATARLFAATQGKTRCALLNACYSAAQAQEIALHIDCAIGMEGAIEDDSAIAFARAFYSALGYGRSVQAAFDLASAQAELASAGGTGRPRLFARRADPAQLFLLLSSQ